VRLEHNFEVPVPVDRAWDVLLDIERIAPCMPGATLTSYEGETFAGNVRVKLGPVNLTYRGTGRFVERDEAARRVVVSASGMDSRGAGTAAATVTSTLHDAGEHTRVEVVTDLDITGKAAQFGRGLIGDVSARLIGQFADCLAGKLAEEPEAAPAPPIEAAAELAPSGSAQATTDAPQPAEVAAPVSPPRAAPVSPPSRAEPAEAEPIDLLAVSGVGPALRRALPYVAVALVSFLVVLGIIWWARRR
jgi:carbon monoxide dehydrogenase subunit G